MTDWMRAQWEVASEDAAKHHLKQLHVEMPQGHILDGRDLRVIARNGLDDIVVVDQDENAFFVHLTYKSSRETNPIWPNTECMNSEQLSELLENATSAGTKH